MNRILFRLLFVAVSLAFAPVAAQAQIQLGQEIDIKPEVDYEIGGITVSGADQLDPTMVALLSGLNVGDKVQFPSERVAQAVRNLWDQELFSDVQLFVTQKSTALFTSNSASPLFLSLASTTSRASKRASRMPCASSWN